MKALQLDPEIDTNDQIFWYGKRVARMNCATKYMPGQPSLFHF